VLLAVAGLTPPLLWRVASAALGVYCLVYPIHYVYRRRRVKPERVPLYAATIYVLTMVVCAVLWLNALTPIFHFSVGPYAIGVTWVLAQAGANLLFTFNEFMRKER